MHLALLLYILGAATSISHRLLYLHANNKFKDKGSDVSFTILTGLLWPLLAFIMLTSFTFYIISGEEKTGISFKEEEDN